MVGRKKKVEVDVVEAPEIEEKTETVTDQELKENATKKQQLIIDSSSPYNFNPKLEYISYSNMKPNNWNPNRMNPKQFEAEVVSIIHNGFIDPITVRDVSKDDDFYYEIIDGEHRWRALKEIERRCGSTVEANKKIKIIEDAIYDIKRGWRHRDGKYFEHNEAIPQIKEILDKKMVPCLNLGGIADVQAKKLTIVMNETRGSADLIELSTVLSDIAKDLDSNLDRLSHGLPYEAKELQEMLSIGKFDWQDVKNTIKDIEKEKEDKKQKKEEKDTEEEPVSTSDETKICCPNCGHNIPMNVIRFLMQDEDLKDS